MPMLQQTTGEVRFADHKQRHQRAGVAVLTAIPTGGQSWFISRWSRPNPHINDQTEMHRTFEYKSVEMNEEKILADAESTTILEPRQP